MISTEGAMQEIFPKNGQVTISISNLFEHYMLLFDEPQNVIDSESTAKDNKVDNQKQVIDDTGQKMADDQSKETERPEGSEPSCDRPNVQGEGSVYHQDQGSLHQPWFAPLKRLTSEKKRGKKTDNLKEGPVSKPTKGQSPKKRKFDKAATSQAQPKKQKNPDRRLILQSTSDSDSEYVPPKHKYTPPSESESESSDDEASGRGDTLPRSPTPKIPVRCHPPSPPPVTIPPIFPIPTTQPFTTIPVPTPIFTTTTTRTTTTGAHFTAPNPPITEPPVTTERPATLKPLSPTQSTKTTTILGGEDLEFDSTYFSSYRVQSDDDDDEPITKRHLKAVNEKLDQLLSSSSSDSLQAAAAKNAQTVNASVENLQWSLQSEHSNLEAARQGIVATNETLHANVNDRLTQLEVKLAVENHIVDELDRRNSPLKMQNYKLRTATIESKQGGEKVTTQPPSRPKPSTEPKGNESSVSNKEKKKKKIGEDDTDNEDDVYAENPKNPFQKVKPSEKEMEESYNKQKAKLEQKRKEAELLEKKKPMFPVWTMDSLQRCAIDEPSILWLEPVMSFGLENSKDAQVDMPITRKAFSFRCFNSTAAIPSPDPQIRQTLLAIIPRLFKVIKTVKPTHKK
ncbi:pollen-specific leucine-rich repeat extensin-like protein 2 [Lactuca sativa]|uniref:pollen-specific leucine-rich repeat extensin-like protein 2 n=1 Tax=Lactuca sativa TaxID=4236 RepID=UPI0022AEFA70|nr:pollen-specific leucine-rich repeat extensin-like protein 2 [Lactuca sativa]